MGAQTFNQITKAQTAPPHRLTVMKSDDERRLVFGWANVAVRVDGEQIVDWQEDIIDTEELEKAAYEYVAEFGTAGEMHRRGGVGRVVESVVFTKEKAEALKKKAASKKGGVKEKDAAGEKAAGKAAEAPGEKAAGKATEAPEEKAAGKKPEEK